MSETAGHRQQRPRSEGRGRCLRRLIVGELRSYSTAYESMAMLDTVATALIAGVTNSGRAYAGAKVLSLTALDHASYPPGSGLCTMLCVVRWCGPAEVAWVATDIDLDAARAPGAHKIAEGALPESLALEFHRAGLLRVPSLCFETCRPMLPPTRFVIAAVRPALDACVAVAADGSVARRCAPGACGNCDRVWRTALRLVEPPSSSIARTANVSAVRPVLRALASTISQALPTAPSLSPQTLPTAMASPLAVPTQAVRPAPTVPSAAVPRRQRQRRQQGRLSEEQHAQVKQSHPGERGPAPAECKAPTTPTAQAAVPPSAAVGVVAAAPVAHPRCACTTCSAASRFCVGKVVRVECTAGCRTAFHRACWRAMAVVPDESRACATPDCWGLWARVTSARRAGDGSEGMPYVEWSRPQRRPVAAVSTRDAKTTTAARRRVGRPIVPATGPPTSSSVSSARSDARTRVPQEQKAPVDDRNPNDNHGDHTNNNSNSNSKNNDGSGGCKGQQQQQEEDEGVYVGRVRRRRPRQQLRGPPHKRIDPLKAVARPPTVDADRSDERAVAEQYATRLKRQQADALVRNAVAAAAAATKSLEGSGRRRRRTRTPKGDDAGTATETPDAGIPQSDALSVGPRDVYGVWAAFFEWDHVPLSLLPEAPATPPPSGQMWTLPPLLRENAPYGPAAWACLCVPAPAN
ncbi:hypothetical protein pdul_cds_1027 [Pandoravirus dulcis]|uniref:Uncharacterized protein n=1 Tax=Pandoravirus dulcis TaxID=1349409 RepID=S4VZL9_9VIRU|nr:hypothetical protein pdul_cds_1027 [Pandoravirus dulcis]AGO83299.1 hypothetical protein pdul_cds_1027 [Pandoravirus dulcis]